MFYLVLLLALLLGCEVDEDTRYALGVDSESNIIVDLDTESNIIVDLDTDTEVAPDREVVCLCPEVKIGSISDVKKFTDCTKIDGALKVEYLVESWSLPNLKVLTGSLTFINPILDGSTFSSFVPNIEKIKGIGKGVLGEPAITIVDVEVSNFFPNVDGCDVCSFLYLIPFSASYFIELEGLAEAKAEQAEKAEQNENESEKLEEECWKLYSGSITCRDILQPSS